MKKIIDSLFKFLINILRRRQCRFDEEDQLKFDQKKPTPAASMSSFPNELLEEIFCKLPARNLIRFNCVCKSWRDLISSKYFINLHLQKSKTSIILVHSSSEEKPCPGSIKPVYPPDTPPEVKSNVDFTCKLPGYSIFTEITASCNGIICIWDCLLPDKIALWNPAIKDLKIVLKSNLPRRSEYIAVEVMFGYDDVSKDYKIIQALYHEESVNKIFRAMCGDHDDLGVQFELFSLDTGSWKKLDMDMDIRAVIKSPDTLGSLCTGNRIVCWLAMFNETAKRSWELVLFDMSTERFEIVQVPVEVSEYRMFIELIPYEGSIGVKYSDANTEELWALNDIHSENGGLRSWRKVDLPIYPPSASSTMTVVAYWEDYFLCHDGKTKLLSLFDHGCQGFDLAGVSKHDYVTTSTRYKESLVRLL